MDTKSVQNMINSSGDIELLVQQILNIGNAMYRAGAEINRIEETLYRLGKAYGAEHVNVYAITSSIVVTMAFEGYPAVTHSRRIHRDSTDLTRLEEFNDLSYGCARELLPVAELEKRVAQIIGKKPSPWGIFAGELLAAAGFAVFFGGTLWDAAASAAGACLIFLMQTYLRPLCSGQFFFNIVASFVTGMAICAANRGLPMLHSGQIIIGDIMVLIPGIAITNSIRYIISGDSISSVEKLIDSLLQGIGIAVGFAVAMWIWA